MIINGVDIPRRFSFGILRHFSAYPFYEKNFAEVFLCRIILYTRILQSVREEIFT